MSTAAPASAREALGMLESAMSYLAADPTAIASEGQAECLQALERLDAVETAVRAAILGAFTAGCSGWPALASAAATSERKLAQMFGRTSRRWARARIADARRVPSSGPTEDPAITVGAQST